MNVRTLSMKPRGRCPFCLCALFVLLVAGCDFPGAKNAQRHPVTSDEALAFDLLYAEKCSGCHGPLNDALFLAIVPNDVLESVIHDGRPGTLMPAFARTKGGTLSDAQVTALAGGLKRRWRSPDLKVAQVPAYLQAAKKDQATAKAAIERGGAAFARACAGCHGDKGEGGSVGALAEHAFLALISNQVLRRLIITGRPDLGMPNYSQADGRDDGFSPLTSAEIDDLVAFIRQLPPASRTTALRERRARRRVVAAASTRTSSPFTLP
jgi:cytochrome c oxidase cbb3-type subunit III